MSLTLADLRVVASLKHRRESVTDPIIAQTRPASFADLVEVIESEGGHTVEVDRDGLPSHRIPEGRYAVLAIPEEETPE